MSIQDAITAAIGLEIRTDYNSAGRLLACEIRPGVVWVLLAIAIIFYLL